MDDNAELSERSGARFREATITVKTSWNLVGQIEQEIHWPHHEVSKRVLSTAEKQVRDALIAQGWTPPQT